MKGPTKEKNLFSTVKPQYAKKNEMLENAGSPMSEQALSLPRCTILNKSHHTHSDLTLYQQNEGFLLCCLRAPSVSNCYVFSL